MTGTAVETTLPFVPAGSISTKNLGFVDRDGTGASLAPMHAPIDTTGARVDPATSERQDAAALLLSQILAAVQAARAETLWTDDSGAFYIRVDNGGALSWVTPAGAPSSGPGAGARPAAGASVIVDRAPYQATAPGTGFATNDFLDHFVTADPASGAPLANFWLNITQGTVLAAAPSSASITPAAVLAPGAATAANQVTQAGSLASILAALGATLKSATQSNAPRVSTTGALAAANAVLTLACDGMATGVAQMSGTWAGTIIAQGSIDGGVTYPVSVGLTPMGLPGGPAVTSVTANGQFEFASAGLTHVQLQMSAFTSGSAGALLAASSGPKIARVKAPTTDPLPVVATNVYSAAAGTNVGVGTSIQGVTGGVPVPVAQQDAQTISLSGSAAGPLTGGSANATTGAISTVGYQGASVYVAGVGTGNTIGVEGSNDGANWSSIGDVSASTSVGSGASSNNVSSVGLYRIPLYTLYIRLRIVAYGSGTVSATLVLKIAPIAPTTSFATLSGASALPTGAATSANQARAVAFIDANSASVAASANSTQTSHAVPTPSIYSKFNAVFQASASGASYVVRGSNDGGTTWIQVATGSLTAGTSAAASVPIVFATYQAYIVNGTNANTVFIASSFTAA